MACDDAGIASFDLIRHHRTDDRVFLYAFDLIELNGDDLRQSASNVIFVMKPPDVDAKG